MTNERNYKVDVPDKLVLCLFLSFVLMDLHLL